jgi:O-antigen/teichoic acid export membrane protein
MNSISKFNNSNESQKIVVTGSIQVAAFLILFMVFVPIYGIFAAAVSIFVAYLASAIPPLIWSTRPVRRFILNSTVATFSGILLGYGILWGTNAASTTTTIVHPIMAISASLALTISITFLLKNTTPKEIKEILKSIK